MKKAFAMFVLAGVASAASAEVAQFGGHVYYNVQTGVQTNQSFGNEVGVTAYDNTTGTTLGAFSSTNLANTWGDDMIPAANGTIDEVTISIFNSGSSAGALLTATLQVGYWDDTAAVAPFNPVGLLGGFSGTVNFVAGLNAGFYSLVTFTGLASLNINLLDGYNVFTQQVSAKTGAANRLGVVSFNPVSIGSSFADFYQNPGPAGAGWYTSSGPVNLGNKTVLIPAPGAMALIGLGGLVAGRRRR